MPAQKTAASRRQPSIETADMSSDPILDSDGEDTFDPVQAATELNRVIDRHKKRRNTNRKRIEKKYKSKVAEIVKTAEMRMDERDKAIDGAQHEHLVRLVAAVEIRDARQRAIAEKIGRFYDSCANLTSLLQSVYSGLAEEARRAELGDGSSQASRR